MNQDLSYQNRDMGNLNPLVPPPEVTPPIKSDLPQPPLNSKTRLLVILGVFTGCLLLISLVASLIKNTNRPTPLATPTLTPDLTPTPTIDPNSEVPAEFKDKFYQIDQSNQTDINFIPPQIDTTIGQ